jgi:hypothetical protein
VQRSFSPVSTTAKGDGQHRRLQGQAATAAQNTTTTNGMLKRKTNLRRPKPKQPERAGQKTDDERI